MYLRPGSVEDAVEGLARHGGRVLAGGTDVFPALVDRVPDGPFTDLSRLAELRGIDFAPGETRIGAGTTWSEIARAHLPPVFDALRAAAREVGSVQIQNRGTIGGNLCNASPAADGVPPLLALDARVELVSPAGRRSLPLEQFLRGNRATARRPDEIMTAVCVPRSLDGAASAFLKLGARRYLVISVVMVAAVLDTDAAGRVRAARVAVGSCSAVARRLRRLEEDLAGTLADGSLGARVTADHLAPLAPIDDLRATAEGRRDAALILVRRALRACLTPRAAEAAVA